MSAPLDPGSLAGLVDIVAPPPVGLWWPLPPLTWLFLALLLPLLSAALWRQLRRWRADRYRREALAVLAGATGDPALRLRGARELLKRAAMTADGREGIAPLAGMRWWRYLDERAPGSAFTDGTGPWADRITARAGAPTAAEVDAFEAAVAFWLRRHPRRPR